MCRARSQQVVLAAILFVSSVFPSHIAAQNCTALQRLSNLNNEWNGAANRWQLTAVDPRTQTDTVPARIRKLRNDFWRPILITDPNFVGGLVAGMAGPHPEFYIYPGDFWVIAKFVSFKIFQTDPGSRKIYTEEVFNISHVFRQPPNSKLIDGSTIEVDVPGGRIKLPSGKILTSAGFQPERYSLKPGHTYLMQFTYDSPGHFFSSGQYWDVTSGRIEFRGPEDSSAHPSIAGLGLDELIAKMATNLPPESQEASH
jgi:hypothetical protein